MSRKMRNTKLPRSIDDLIPAPYQPREISEDAAGGLRESLRRFGDLSGIVWNRSTGHVVAGHQRIDQLRALGAELETRGGLPELVVGDERYTIRIVEMTETEEKAANLTANNPAIAGEFTGAVDEIVRSLQDDIGSAVQDLRLDHLLGGDGDWQGIVTELKEWDASEIVMRALFVFRAPIEMQAKIRAVLTREFPEVEFDEEIIHT